MTKISIMDDGTTPDTGWIVGYGFEVRPLWVIDEGDGHWTGANLRSEATVFTDRRLAEAAVNWVVEWQRSSGIGTPVNPWMEPA